MIWSGFQGESEGAWESRGPSEETTKMSSEERSLPSVPRPPLLPASPSLGSILHPLPQAGW